MDEYEKSKIVLGILEINQYCREQDNCNPQCAFFMNGRGCSFKIFNPGHFIIPEQLKDKENI